MRDTIRGFVYFACAFVSWHARDIALVAAGLAVGFILGKIA